MLIYKMLKWMGVILLLPFVLTGCIRINPGDVVINEIAWMGTDESELNQWIELRNNTDRDISLKDFELVNRDQSLVIPLNMTIPAYGYLLLERNDDATVPEVTADIIYTGMLGATDESLALKDAKDRVIDIVPLWFVGNADTKATMERAVPDGDGMLPSTWATAKVAYSVGLGTPALPNEMIDGEPSDPNCNYPSQLEVTSINIGQGDSTLIASKTKLLLADAGDSFWNSHRDANKIAETIHALYGENCHTLDYVVISHIHTDHIGYIRGEEDANGDLLNEFGQAYQEGDNLLNVEYLGGYAYLVGELGFTVGQTLLRDYKTHNPNPTPQQGGSKSYRNWRAMFESVNGKALFNPVTATLGDGQIDLGTVNGVPVRIDIIHVDAATPANPEGCDPATYFGGAQYLARGQRYNDSVPPSENDLSIAFMLSFNKFQFFVGGDQSGDNHEAQWGYRYHDTETCLAEDSIVKRRYGNKLEVLRANHHGSSHSTNQQFLDAFSPKVTIFSVGDNNNFNHVDKGVLDRTLEKTSGQNQGKVFMTESGAAVYAPEDACHSSQLLCAEIADEEFPLTVESDESGDASVSVLVNLSGTEYSVQGALSVEAVNYEAK